MKSLKDSAITNFCSKRKRKESTKTPSHTPNSYQEPIPTYTPILTPNKKPTFTPISWSFKRLS